MLLLMLQIYAIVANTEIVFECIMTKVYLRREVSMLQVIAVSLVIAGVLVSLWNPVTGDYGSTDDDGYDSSDLLFGLGVSVVSRVASSVNTILADRSTSGILCIVGILHYPYSSSFI